jgi:hypothetical protein
MENYPVLPRWVLNAIKMFFYREAEGDVHTFKEEEAIL